MRIIDGWHVMIKIGHNTWGFGPMSIIFILFGLLCLYICIKTDSKWAFSFCLILAIGYIVCACYCKPITKTITEYKIEYDDTAKVNDFFNRFELQEIVDESHYIVRIKNWKDQLN